MNTVALVTDFGRRDSYVGELHAAIRERAESIRVVDVTHDVPPFDRVSAAMIIERVMHTLPLGSALVAVVDPGVGSSRSAIAALSDGRWLVGPDNGIFSLEALAREGRVWSLAAFPRRAVTARATTFDGRELFGPAGALLATGLDPRLLGEPVRSVVASVLPPTVPWSTNSLGLYAEGVVIGLDHYGNAVTSVRAPELLPGQHVEIVEPQEFSGKLGVSYGSIRVGEPLALVNSCGRVELARREAPSKLLVGTRVMVVVR